MKKTGPITIIVLCLITSILYLSSKTGIEVLANNYLLSLSQYFALIGTLLLSISYVLATRNHLVEKLFGGLDRVYKAHAITSGLAFLLLLYHPLLLIIKVLPNFRAALIYIVPGNELGYTAGIMAMFFMILLITITLYIDLPYSLWKKTHEYMGVVILIALVHVFLINSDVSRSILLRSWMLGWIAIGIFSFIYKRFLYGILGPKAEYLVKEINRTGDVIALTLTATDKPLHYQSGQFGFLQEHPFSFASHPSEKNLRFGIKIRGTHTLSLRNLVVGERITIQGPYGCFGERIYTKNPVVLIAGGIGITPIVSIAKEASLKRTSPTYVFCVSKNQDVALFEDEIKQMPNLKSFNHYSDKSGRFGINQLTVVPDLKSAKVFICGPSEMIESLSNQLYEYGLKKNQVIYEDFNLK